LAFVASLYKLIDDVPVDLRLRNPAHIKPPMTKHNCAAHSTRFPAHSTAQKKARHEHGCFIGCHRLCQCKILQRN
jgi:hypothetical protein